MISFKQYISELFDKPYRYVLRKLNRNSYMAELKLQDGSPLNVHISSNDGRRWEIEFRKNYSINATGEGDEFKIFSTVISIIKEFVELEAPAVIMFYASKDDGNSRAKLYTRMVKKFANKMGYSSQSSDVFGAEVYTLKKKK